MHALLGENGAGKSTLLGVLDGLIAPDSGRILLDGQPVRPDSPRAAARLGIGRVHQHFALVPAMTVLENVALGTRERGSPWRDPAPGLRGRLLDLQKETGLEVDPDAPVELLGVGARQRVEILKLLLRDPAVLALDEPTAVLAPGEIETLFALLRRLAASGRAILLVAHKLEEVLSVADRLTVLRSGRTVLEASRSEVDAGTLARAMVGTDRPTPPPPEDPRPGEVVASVSGVRARGLRGEEALRGIDLEVRLGEIVGIAGVEGNGQRELALVLSGRAAPTAGQVSLPADPALIPQDRRIEGLVGDFGLTGNLALGRHRDPGFRAGPFLRWGALRREAGALLGRYDIRTEGTETPVRTLSGGNQQKVVVAREAGGAPRFLVAENPTRGLDFGATDFVRAELRALRAAGSGILLLSTDLDEVLLLADRILVLHRGRLHPIGPGERSREGVGARMLTGGAAA